MESIQLKKLMKTLQPQIDAALAEVAAKNGLASLKLGRGTFFPSAGTFTFKLEGMVSGGKGVEAVRYEENAQWMNLPPLGTKFVTSGVEYETAGLNTTATKVLCRKVKDGTVWLFRPEAVGRLTNTPAHGPDTLIQE